jgi:hypothetical protein
MSGPFFLIYVRAVCDLGDVITSESNMSQPMPNPVRRWLNDNSAALAAIVALLTISGILYGTVKFFFAQSPVSVFVGQTDLYMPPSLAAQVDSVLKVSKAKEAAVVLSSVKDFIEDTRSFTVITISNNTNNSVHNLELRVQAVHALPGYAATSSNLLDEEQKAILDSIHYDRAGSLFRLRSVPRLPPKSSVNIWLWGVLPFNEFLAEDQITVTYDGGVGTLVHRYPVEGYDAFIYRNSEILTILIIALNLGLFQTALNFELRRRREA